jgi:hypothetical protein
MPHFSSGLSASSDQRSSERRAQKLEEEVRELNKLLTREQAKTITMGEELSQERKPVSPHRQRGMKAELKATIQAFEAANKELTDSSRPRRTGSTKHSPQVYSIDRQRRPYGPREQPTHAPGTRSKRTLVARDDEQGRLNDQRRPNGPRAESARPPSNNSQPYVEDDEEEPLEQEEMGENWLGSG